MLQELGATQGVERESRSREPSLNRPEREVIPAPLKFGWDSVAKVISEPNWNDLVRSHWDELAVTKDDCPLDVDYDLALRLEAEGIFRIWTARDGKTLVGYIGWLIRPHFHYRSTLHATEDLYLLAPAYRQGSNGYRFFKSSIEALKPLGVKRVMLHRKIHQDGRGGERQGKFFARLGFFDSDIVSIRIL